MYEIKLADGTKIENLTLNGNNFVSKTPIDDSIFDGNLSKVKITHDDEIEEYTDMKLIQNKQYGNEYWFVLTEKTPAEKEREELLQVIADLVELTLEVSNDG